MLSVKRSVPHSLFEIGLCVLILAGFLFLFSAILEAIASVCMARLGVPWQSPGLHLAWMGASFWFLAFIGAVLYGWPKAS